LKRKIAIVGALVIVLAGGLVGAFVLRRLHESRNVHGSSTEEFVTTEKRHPFTLHEGIQWPMYGFDPARQRAPDGVKLRPPFRPIWGFNAQTLVEFPPAVAYRHLYFANGHGLLFALDRRTKRVTWSYPSRRCAAASPAVEDRVVYESFMNHPPCNATRSGIDGELVAFNAVTGKILWRKRLAPTESSPLVVNGLVYVGDWSGKIYAFDAENGRARWSYATGGQIKGAVAFAGGRIYVGSYDSHVYALNARTGRLVWRAAAQQRLGPRGRFYSTPAVRYGRVYIGSTDGKVYSYGATSGKLRWSYGTGGYVYASPAVWNRRVFVGSYSGTFYCFDAATGAVRWRFTAKGPISGSAVVLNGVVYFASLGGPTYALDTRSGKLLWSFAHGEYASPVSAGRQLYVTGYARMFSFVEKSRR
jgi:outer membrane protein assembly factor BamB